MFRCRELYRQGSSRSRRGKLIAHLEYRFTHGEAEKGILASAYGGVRKRRGAVSDVRLPDFIKNAPELWFWLHPYYEAFGELSTCRPVDGFTGTVGRIPWTAIDRYADRHEWAGRDFDLFVLYMGALDDKLIELVKAKKPKTPNKAPRDPRSTKGGMGEPED